MTHLVQVRALGVGQGCYLGEQGRVLEEQWVGHESAASQRGQLENAASVSCCWRWSEDQVFQAQMEELEEQQEEEEIVALFFVVEERPIVSVTNIYKKILFY